MVSLATRVWARELGGNAVFGDLKPGDTFRFPKSDVTYVKTKGGWYRVWSVLGRSYRTGSGTAVRKLEYLNQL